MIETKNDDSAIKNTMPQGTYKYIHISIDLKFLIDRFKLLFKNSSKILAFEHFQTWTERFTYTVADPEDFVRES